MKIMNIQPQKFVKSLALVTPLLLTTPALKAQTFELEQDSFYKSNELLIEEPADSMLLSPEVKVANDTIYPAIVVDISEFTSTRTWSNKEDVANRINSLSFFSSPNN